MEKKEGGLVGEIGVAGGEKNGALQPKEPLLSKDALLSKDVTMGGEKTTLGFPGSESKKEVADAEGICEG